MCPSVFLGVCTRFSTLNATTGIVTDGPGDYENFASCTWTIAPPNVSRVEIVFTFFILEGPASCCAGDYIQVYECSDLACVNKTTLGKISGTMSNVPPSLVSTTGILQLYFFSDFQAPMAGFNATYFSPCPPGSFGPGLPDCAPCTTSCPPGNYLKPTSCGAFGATADNECNCPAGTHPSNNSSCLPCPVPCKAGAFDTSASRACCSRVEFVGGHLAQ